MPQQLLFPPDLFIPPDDGPQGLLFRLAKMADCQPLHASCYPEKAFVQFDSHFRQLLHWQENGRCAWLIVFDKKEQIIASGQLVLYPHGAELANLVVVPARRGEGVGTALVGMLTAVARHLTLPSLEIGVAASNGRALSLYQRLGFSEDRRLHLPGAEPAIILHKDL